MAVLEGENCTFDCLLSHDVIEEPTWTINGQLVVSDGRLQVVNNGRQYKLSIKPAILLDAGDVVFTIKDLSCRTMLFIRGKQPGQRGNYSVLVLYVHDMFPMLISINTYHCDCDAPLQRSRCMCSGRC